jgi:hypothetical protein
MQAWRSNDRQETVNFKPVIFSEIQAAGDNQCWPGPVPFILTNVGMQMLQHPDKITILYADTYEVRRVRMNQPHPAQVTPSWYGD